MGQGGREHEAAHALSDTHLVGAQTYLKPCMSECCPLFPLPCQMSQPLHHQQVTLTLRWGRGEGEAGTLHCLGYMNYQWTLNSQVHTQTARFCAHLAHLVTRILSSALPLIAARTYAHAASPLPLPCLITCATTWMDIHIPEWHK